MAETPEEHEKTEDPSQKKLDDALKKGDVAKSQEVNSWFVMIAATLMIMMFSGDAASSLARQLKTFLDSAHDLPVDGEGLRALTWALGVGVLSALALPFLLMIIAGISGNLVQHRLLFSVEPIIPKLSKISPLSGFKRLFSKTSLVNFAKSMAKLIIVGSVITVIVWPNRDRLDALVAMDPASILSATQAMAGQVLIGVVAILAVVAALDFAWQKHTWWEKQKMTIKEVRDEYKQMEGDPQVRAKLRQVRIERGRKRMMANVPNASVVVTNPTHYSVALQYEPGMNAPVCVAKGVDAIALRIREIAKDHEIPLVENPPLARALYAGVEIDDEIPEEHYKAVAEVIGYVMRLRRGTSGAGRS
ncbi:MAG: flagellar biosynthesis protein FlhB [Alphaproteobacteria bacterium]|nr:MAG: flagellar biosynthesis protein FlhB [Alphaproteobacteria bacterium]